jgi:potassium-transporting ATPase KdpC subunit
MIRRQFFAAVRVLLVLTALLGVLYPLAVTGIAQVTMPHKANGSLVRSGGAAVGSSLIGQEFTGPEWFHGRPDAFDPAASGASNLGPSNELLAGAARLAAGEVARGESWAGLIPSDAVSGSGSGLDPHISPAYARIQAPRVAAARGLEGEEVLDLVARLTEGRTLGFLGEPRVNVLLLNLALSGLQP